MKLLHIIRGTDPEAGGPIEALLRFSDVWMRSGHSVEIASLEPEETATRHGLPVPVNALGNSVGRFGYSPRLVGWLRRNAGRFDAVILHGLWNYASWGSWRALRNLPMPYFVFAHGMLDPWFRDSYPVKHMAKQLYWWFAEGRVLRDARSVLFTCEEERVRARGQFWGPGYRERVVLLGTSEPPADIDRQDAAFDAAFPALQRKRFLLFMGRIHPKKGCDILIQAFAAAGGERQDLDLVIAGPDQVGWKTDLLRMANRLGISERVHWPGMLKGDLKWGAYRNADAMILPSHQENFGFVVAEAMACSTPVLISNKVNTWREVDSAQAGFVEADDLHGTQTLLRRFWALSEEDRKKMREAARRGFEQYFDVEVAARSFLRTIETEIDKEPAISSCQP